MVLEVSKQRRNKGLFIRAGLTLLTLLTVLTIAGGVFFLQDKVSDLSESQDITSQAASQKVCSGDACSDCILNLRSDILPFYKSNGWKIDCANQVKVVNNWCGPTVDPKGCLAIKENQCAKECGVVAATPTPTKAVTPTPTPTNKPTPTPTSTPRPTPTPTRSPTPTPTRRPTPTPTKKLTNITPTPTKRITAGVGGAGKVTPTPVVVGIPDTVGEELALATPTVRVLPEGGGGVEEVSNISNEVTPTPVVEPATGSSAWRVLAILGGIMIIVVAGIVFFLRRAA